MHQKQIFLRIAGLIISLLSTLGIYFLALQPNMLGFSSRAAINVVYLLALLQAAAQFIFFLDIWKEKETNWNVGVFVSTLSIIFIIIFFSIWVMETLNYNMMPMPEMQTLKY
jgi:cytochrome o ubiquinol oxidase operon protein cyoD